MSSYDVTLVVRVSYRSSRAARESLRDRLLEAVAEWDAEGDYQDVLDVDVRVQRTVPRPT